MGPVTSIWEEQMQSPVSNLLRGDLVRVMLLQVHQLKLLAEEEVEAVDLILRRNDFSLQLMAIIPAAVLIWLVLLLLRQAWQACRTNSRGPVGEIRAILISIEGALTRAASPPALNYLAGLTDEGVITQHEASPMGLVEAGEIVFHVQRLRGQGSHWLRGLMREDLLHDAQELLDSGRLTSAQRANVAKALLRRLDRINSLFDHW